MHKRKIFYVIMLMAGMVTLFSCEYEKIVYDVPDPTIQVSYATDIQSIWNKGCVGCHGTGQNTPDLTATNSYNALINGGFVDTAAPDQSVIYTSMISGGSMAPYTNAKDAGTVLIWIQQGAKNN
ncbi:MAG: cytochrome c [Bacteroidota bacterium]